MSFSKAISLCWLALWQLWRVRTEGAYSRRGKFRVHPQPKVRSIGHRDLCRAMWSTRR